MKICKSLWESGVYVGVEECRKWLNRDVEGEFSRIGEILRNYSWKHTVLLNQLLHISPRAETIENVVEKVSENPLGFVVNLRKYHDSVKDVESILNFPISDVEYGERSDSIVDFFLNYMRFEEGVDVDRVVNSLKELLEREQLVEEFLRLCDIDAPAKAEVFLEKVERGVDILSKAREQGLDVGMIIKRWDEKANEGGERFQYLEDAVKEVADEEVRRRFWREVERVLGEEGVRVTGKDGLFDRFFYLELVDVNGLEVDITPGREVLERLSRVLKNGRPVPFYTAEEVTNILKMFGVDRALSKEEIIRALAVGERLDRIAVERLIKGELDIYRVTNQVESPDEEVASLVNNAVKDAVKEGVSNVMEYIEKRLQPK